MAYTTSSVAAAVAAPVEAKRLDVHRSLDALTYQVGQIEAQVSAILQRLDMFVGPSEASMKDLPSVATPKPHCQFSGVLDELAARIRDIGNRIEFTLDHLQI